MNALVWFRSDLRSEDNTALFEACRDADAKVTATFVMTPGQWRQHDWGPPKVDFVLRNAQALAQRLGRLGIPFELLTVDDFAATPEALLRAADECGADALYFNREYEVNERARDLAVARAFESAGRVVRAFDDQTIVPPATLKTGGGDFYKVFTPFRRAWLDALRRSGLPQTHPCPRQRGAAVRPAAVPQRVAGFDASPLDSGLWPAGEDEARRRLERFVAERIRGYDARRDYPGEDGTSALSPYLACGAISARSCLEAAVEANTGWLDEGEHGIVTWISELVWREFYRAILVGYPRVSKNRPFKLETERLPWSENEEALRRWCAGRTGVPIVDAAMRQLRRTGWMHNRLRMIAAMYLSKDLFVDWRHGERHFMRSLVDADLANNNGGWQWSASTGCDAAPYFRMFNPVKQSERWDPEGAFIRRYCPELAQLDARRIHDPAALPPAERANLDWPLPLVDSRTARDRVIAAFQALQP